MVPAPALGVIHVTRADYRKKLAIFCVIRFLFPGFFFCCGAVLWVEKKIKYLDTKRGHVVLCVRKWVDEVVFRERKKMKLLLRVCVFCFVCCCTSSGRLWNALQEEKKPTRSRISIHDGSHFGSPGTALATALSQGQGLTGEALTVTWQKINLTHSFSFIRSLTHTNRNKHVPSFRWHAENDQ